MIPPYFTSKIKKSGPLRYAKDGENIGLTVDQAKYIYEKVEWESIVNVETIKQEIEDDRLDKDNNNEEETPYWNIITNEFYRESIIASQMEQWSILSTHC